ncbi:C40 family peptidase [Odoribacter sp. OttesenSCG-928-A06]|nr:C40 family peptidase [Odoribacter sp. OttesenSCG-928-A06]
MIFGIADLSIVPMRREPSERSEMVSQVLFGELFEILEETDKWLYIRLLHDDYKGWIDKKMYAEVSESYAQKYQEEPQLLTSEVFNMVNKEGDYSHKLVVSGSVLPFLDIETNRLFVGDASYSLMTKLKDISVDNIRDLLIEYALMYYNTPYLWGGRSPYGIDCSGLTQTVYRLTGINIPRDASQQVLIGQDLSFVEEALPGDLAFFGDSAGVITHVGILWKDNRIIHASGRVRVDKIDHNGIFNEELKRYTHHLKIIKRVL